MVQSFALRLSPKGLKVQMIKDKKGYTLVELMMAILLTLIVLSAAYSTYIAQQRSFTAQDQVAEMQSSSKTAFDLMVKEIKEAGFGVPDNPSINGVTRTISHPTTGNNAGVNSSDALTILGGFRLMGTLSVAGTIGANSVTVLYNSDVYFDTTNKSHISFMGLQYAQITAHTTSTVGGNTYGNITLDRGLNKPFPSGTPVYLIEDATYRICQRRPSDSIDCGTALIQNATFVLRREGRAGMPNENIVIADNIEDIQFDSASNSNRLGVYLLARTARPDPNFQNQGIKPDIPVVDDVAGTSNDSYRRRLWLINIHYRNNRP